MQHISRKVITHFSHFSHLGYRPTVYCVRDVVGPYPCEHGQLTLGCVPAGGGSLSVATQFEATPTKGSSVAKVHMDIDVPHLKKSKHSFLQFSHLGYRPTVQCARGVVGPYPCEHWQLYSHWRGWSLVVFQLQPDPCRRWQLTRRDPDEGSSVAKVHMDIDATHLKKSNHSFSHFSNLGSRPTVQCVRGVVGPYPCEHWQLTLGCVPAGGGGLSVATH
jgi:hypothetical protein